MALILQRKGFEKTFLCHLDYLGVTFRPPKVIFSCSFLVAGAV